MEAPFCRCANDNSALLEQVPIDVCAGDAPIGGKADAHELAEPTRIVIPLCLRVAERPQE
jgi:hypothetical protein